MLRSFAPKGDRRMGANPHANGGLLLRDLRTPDFRDYGVRAALARLPDRLLLQLHTAPGAAPFLLSFRLLHLWHR